MNFLCIIIVGAEKPQRRGSVGSLDSGMSISFQSTSASTGSRSDSKMRMIPGGGGQHPGGVAHLAHPIPSPQNQGILGGIFQKRERKPSRTEDGTGPFGRSTEV